jgi:hypothetical protein
MIQQFSKDKPFDIVDINPELSVDGVVKSEYSWTESFQRSSV